MSVAIAEPGLSGAAEVPDGLPSGIASQGIALSAALHVVIVGLLIFGLPKLFDPPVPEEMPVTVELVTIAPETRATRPNPNPPRPDAKLEVPELEAPVAKPEPKPEPPKPAPVPPPTAAVPPEPKPAPPQPAKPPEPKTEPPKPAEKVETLYPAPPLLLKLPEPKPEPPKPVEKVEAPKPRAKPEPPRQMAKNEAKPEEKKYDPGQFEALLKNLAPQQTAPSPDAPPQRARVASARPSSQPMAPLGSQMTASEVDLIRRQIARCWNVPAGARDAKDLVVEIRVVVDRDGTVQQATIVDQGRMGSDPTFRAAAESARRAFFNPQCRPLHLPAEKYAIWKDLVVDFSPKDVL
jgi:outer membrane biosynthesis protein TonB